MQRYFITECSDNQALITGEDARHIQKVMRMQVADELIVVYQQQAYLATILTLNEEGVLVAIGELLNQNVELPVPVSIICGLPKGDKLDWITQKSTELGVHSIYPTPMARSITKWDEKKSKKRVERLQKIAKEAAEQSHRLHVPLIEMHSNLQAVVHHFKSYTHRFIAYEEEAREQERVSLQKKMSSIQPGESVCIIFGPEGGLAEQEIQLLMKEGFETIPLGPRILRTETAPLYFLSALSYHLEG